jgi:hypothetical protein
MTWYHICQKKICYIIIKNNQLTHALQIVLVAWNSLYLFKGNGKKKEHCLQKKIWGYVPVITREGMYE